MSAPKATCPECRLPWAEHLCDDDIPGPETPAARDVPAIRCHRCLDDGMVCEDHPEFPWEGVQGTVEGHAEHGGIGMPCPACCSPVAEDGTHSIAEAFTPDWKRASARL